MNDTENSLGIEALVEVIEKLRAENAILKRDCIEYMELIESIGNVWRTND